MFFRLYFVCQIPLLHVRNISLCWLIIPPNTRPLNASLFCVQTSSVTLQQAPKIAEDPLGLQLTMIKTLDTGEDLSESEKSNLQS